MIWVKENILFFKIITHLIRVWFLQKTFEKRDEYRAALIELARQFLQ
jgi:hypothetical protein